MSELARQVPGEIDRVHSDVSIGAILSRAVDQGMAPESLEKLVALYERLEDRSAAKEFASAMAAFQSECPPIPKTATAKIATRAGGSYAYTFAPLEKIAEFIRPYLEKHGLSYTWDSADSDGKLNCTCTARHVNGHSVPASFICPTDTAAAMSGAQKSGAALTYARRQSLIQVFGLTTADPDNDGGGQEKISDHQIANLEALMGEVGANQDRFLKYMGVSSLDEIAVADYAAAISALEAKRQKAGQP